MANTSEAARDPALLRALDAVTQVCNVAGTALILFLMVLIGIDVLGRNLANAPLSGVPEMVSLSIVAIVFLQAPQALKAGRFTQSTALIELTAQHVPRLVRGVETLFDLVGIAVVGAIFYASWPLFVRAWSRGDFVGAIGDFVAPTWPVKGLILLGCGLLILQFAARISRRLRAQS